jgi:hypothetical protein
MTKHQNRERLLTILCALIIGVSVLVINLRWNPLNGPVLQSDSGVYAYIGSALARGQVLYRDVWEQKPPVGFYLDALAVRLMGQTPWAIWWLDWTWLALAAILLMLLIRRMMGLIPALLASLVFISGALYPAYYGGGNLMEIYGFVPQVLAIAAAFGFFATRRIRWVFLCGLMTGMAFMTKQTTISLGAASAGVILLMSLLWRDIRNFFLRGLAFAGGFLLPLGLAALYWSATGAFQAFVAGVFTYSMAYTEIGLPFQLNVKNTVETFFPTLYISWLYYLACAAFLLFIPGNFWLFFRLLLPKTHQSADSPSNQIPPVEMTMLVVFLALPFELVMTSLGGRDLLHYFLTLLPALAITCAYILWKTIFYLRGEDKQPLVWRRMLGGLGLLLSLGALTWSAAALVQDAPTAVQLESFPRIFSDQYSVGDLANYILANTSPNDSILIWHIQVAPYFTTNRHPPQRIVFPAELFIPVNQAQGNLEEFLGELKKTPPRLIIVQEKSSISMPFVNIPVDQMCPKGICIPELAAALQNPGAVEELNVLRQYFLAHYTLATEVDDWLIYQRLP